MSKLVKDLITDDLKGRFDGVNDLFLVNVVGLDAIKTQSLRKQLREKGIHLMVVKNSLARRATEGTVLAPAFEGATGTLAVVWGATDVVSLAKEITRLADNKNMVPFSAAGGVMDGAKLSAAEVKAVSKWPTREEQISLLVGQILSPGAKLASQLNSVGGALVSQLKEKCKAAEEGTAEPATAT
jgi:large subunit ribosomal protein L10